MVELESCELGPTGTGTVRNKSGDRDRESADQDPQSADQNFPGLQRVKSDLSNTLVALLFQLMMQRVTWTMVQRLTLTIAVLIIHVRNHVRQQQQQQCNKSRATLNALGRHGAMIPQLD